VTVTTNKFLVAALYLGWLVSSAAMAQALDTPQPTSSLNHQPGSVAHPDDITVAGTVQKVVSKHTPGTPVGVHLLVNREQGVIDANVGPYLSKSVQRSLSSGKPVQIVGFSQTSGGQNYLLARQIVVSGRQIVIRNEHGFLVRPQSQNISRRHKGQTDLNGGNQ